MKRVILGALVGVALVGAYLWHKPACDPMQNLQDSPGYFRCLMEAQ